MTILPACCCLPLPPSLYLSRDWERLARGNSRATRRGSLVYTLHDWQLGSCNVLSCLDSFFSLHTHTRGWGISQNCCEEKKKKRRRPRNIHTRNKKKQKWSAPLGRLKDLLYYATHRWGGVSVAERDRAQSAQHISTTDTISPPPPPNRTSCK